MVNTDAQSHRMSALVHQTGQLAASLNAEAERLNVQEAALDPESAMASNLLWRESAKVAFIHMDNDNRVRWARLGRATPTRGPFPVGSYVYFRRTQPRPGESPALFHRWFGVARVIGHDARDPERLDDRGLRPPLLRQAQGSWQT